MESFVFFLKENSMKDLIKINRYSRPLMVKEALDNIALIELHMFEKAIQEHLEILHKIFSLQSHFVLSFLRINIKPWKQAIEPSIAKAATLYSSYLQARVFEASFILNVFFKESMICLDTAVRNIEQNDYENPTDVCESIRYIISNADHIPRRLANVTRIIDVLRSFGIGCEQIKIGKINVQSFLNEAPKVWEAIISKAFQTRNKIRLHI